MSVSFYYNPNSLYPESGLYEPARKYPEYPFYMQGNLSENNDIYEMIRQVLILHKLDLEHVGTMGWNPLGYAIKQGNTVLLKPNLVRDINPAEKKYDRGMHCLITHPSVVRCIFDYVYIALKGKGKIIIADAPVQGCDYERLLKMTGYGKLFEFFESCSTSELIIETADLREYIMDYTDNIPEQIINQNSRFGSTIVDLEKTSYFNSVKKKRGLRVTWYAGPDTISHHIRGKNEYCISDAALMADVIINIPKPKTHRIAGYTGALKNLIGVNARKEYLPHHTLGNSKSGGDEYKGSHTILHYINSKANDYRFTAIVKKHTKVLPWLNWVGRLTGRKLDTYEKDRIRYGMWYGNDTIWRTILDVNKIILYADKNGIMKDEAQRKIISIGDMIVCGEKEGPLKPNYKYVGGILFSDNPVLFDLFVAKIMGFHYENFKVLKIAVEEQKLFKCRDYIVKSNEMAFANNIFEISEQFKFVPTKGWEVYLMIIRNED